MADRRRRPGGRRGNQETRAPRNANRHLATVEIIDRLFSEPVEIVENRVRRKVSTLEAILMRLWAAELSGSKRASRVRLQFLELVPRDDKEREFIIEEIYDPSRIKTPIDRQGRIAHG